MTAEWAALPWQREILSRLLGQDRQGRLPHALLLEGPPGLGKGHLARALANYLLCLEPRGEQACGHCGGCQLVLAGSHPDLRVVVPEGKRNIRVDQIRECLEFLARTAQRGERKILILQPAELMNLNAANALLKGLEEPGAGSLLLLVSDQPAQLLATVRSRCQRISLGKPDRRLAAEWLAAQSVRAELLELADGAPLRALALADDEAWQERGRLQDSLQAMLRGELGAVDAATRCAGNLDLALESMLFCLGDLLRFVQSGGSVPPRDPGTQGMGRILLERQTARRGTAAALHRLYQSLLAARRAVASNSNPNPQLLLESLFLDWRKLAR